MTEAHTALYSLPPLPFAHDALEPWCSAETLALHHDKHHGTYVTEANTAAEALTTVDPHDTPRLAGLQSALTFNLAGHVMHSLFWDSLDPASDGPGEEMHDQLVADFGSVERFNDLITAACVGVHGSGWGVLRADPVTGALGVSAVHDHQSEHVAGSTTLAVIDVWEHAYYLTHRNERAKWVAAAVQHLNWANIAQRYSRVQPVGATS
jgi:Fe-Mn family superoxide dismutase